MNNKMKLNKCIQLAIIGVAIFVIGMIWDIITTVPDLFRRIDITLPPTYQILEVLGIIIFVYALYCKFRVCKKETEEE